jgi:hypothetical protein
MLDLATLRRLSVARWARVSHLTHDNVHDIVKDLELAFPDEIARTG